VLHIHRVLEDHEWQLAERQQRYGTNEMRVPVKGVAALVADEMWHPFYVFQYFSVVIWVAGDQYYIYAVCIFLITAFSIITSSVETHRNMKRLAELAHYTCSVRPWSGPLHAARTDSLVGCWPTLLLAATLCVCGRQHSFAEYAQEPMLVFVWR
jgi:magnesium-transporting ATPase (P-type)